MSLILDEYYESLARRYVRGELSPETKKLVDEFLELTKEPRIRVVEESHKALRE